MRFCVTSTHRLPGSNDFAGKAYWLNHQFSYFPEYAKLFETHEQAEAFAMKRLENGWAKRYNIDTDVRIEEVES